MAFSLLSQSRILGRPCSSGRKECSSTIVGTPLRHRFAFGGILPAPVAHRQSTRGRDLRVRAIESPTDVAVNVHNEEDATYTIIDVEGNRSGWGGSREEISLLCANPNSCCRVPGILNSISAVLRDLALDVGKAQVSGDDVRFRNRFFVQRTQGGKVTDPQQIKEITTALGVLLKAKSALSAVSRPKFDSPQGDTGRMNALMGACSVSCIKLPPGPTHARPPALQTRT